MKRPCLPPLLVLAAILVLAGWNGAAMRGRTDRWRAELRQVEQLAISEDWEAASNALEDSYRDWSRCQTYLHIVSPHDAVDDAESMYQRAAAFAATQELSEFRAELSDLRAQLRFLAEMERLSIKNIL
jgi:oligoendopeptidase F